MYGQSDWELLTYQKVLLWVSPRAPRNLLALEQANLHLAQIASSSGSTIQDNSKARTTRLNQDHTM